MTEDAGWNFPDNRHTEATGFDTGNQDIFQRDPVAHFAREICQNSIDARDKDLGPDKPVRVDFELFDIAKSDLPGYQDLYNEVEKCRDYSIRINKPKEQEISESILRALNPKMSESISCMRISDYNTTGLFGVKDNMEGKPFFELTKGSGSSEKTGESAGSKGIGKFAAFTISKARTVFYSTLAKNPETKEIEKGYIGISRLRSRPLENDSDLLTKGNGYYALGEKNLPVEEELFLGSFRRSDIEFGTDIYIIGFEEYDWEENIIKAVLDSFMAAIVYGELEVNVGNRVVNKNTVDDIVNKIKKQARLKSIDKSIISQYELLTLNDGSVYRETVKIDGSDIKIMVKAFKSVDEDYATRKCARIRWPYMKIDEYKGRTAIVPYSALCLIGRNELNRQLRDIEDAPHTEWQLERLRDDKKKYDKVRNILRNLKKAIDNYITEVLQENAEDSTDFEGAGEYLPDEEEGTGDIGGKSESNDETPVVTAPTRRQAPIHGRHASSDGDDDTQHGMGTPDEEGGFEGAQVTGGGGGDFIWPNPEPNPDPEPQRYEPGGKTPILKKNLSKNTKFRCWKNTASGEYIISFKALEDAKDCSLAIAALGDSRDSERVKIEAGNINGNLLKIENGVATGFSIKKDERYVIKCNVKRKDMFASKVELYASPE